MTIPLNRFAALASVALLAGCTMPMSIEAGPSTPLATKATVGEGDRLDPALRRALRDATRSAATDDVQLRVTSGWRSREHQQRLLDEAVQKYGSLDAALRFVSTPENSAHVTGDAVDIGPAEADAWLEQHGATWGLCRVFANEIWHFELATDPGGTCPDMLPDSSYRNRG